MFRMSNFKSKSKGLESLVRTAMTHGELAPGVAAQVNRYRNNKLSCEEQRLLAILDDAISDGCITPIEIPGVRRVVRQVVYSVS
ncbi:MAG: hypothetical protein AAFQ95_24910 [Cyanobacteria bacterium J06621_3]